MSEQLSPNYWSDVNRYCGELLAGTAAERAGFWTISSVVHQASWPAAEQGTTSTLEQGTVRYVGGLIRRSYHILRLKTPTAGMTDMIEYGIKFDPNKEVITRASRRPEFKLPEGSEVKSVGDSFRALGQIMRYNKEYKQGTNHMKEMGLDVPGPDDYELLLSELQLGAAGKA